MVLNNLYLSTKSAGNMLKVPIKMTLFTNAKIIENTT